MAYLVATGRGERKTLKVRYVPRGGGPERQRSCHTYDRSKALAILARIEAEDEEPRSRAPARPQAGLLEAFLDSRRAQGCTEDTVRFYRAKAGPLLRFLDGRGPMSGWNRSDTEAWLVLPRAAPWSDRQRGAMITTAHTVYEWAVDSGYEIGNFPGKLKPPKVRRAKRESLTAAQVKALLAVSKRAYRLAIALAAYAGLRINDIRTLDCSHVDLVGGWITKAATKNHAPLRLPIPESLRIELAANPVVAGRVCRVAKESAARHGLARIFDDAGVPRAKGDGWHRLRHFYASTLDEIGATDGERRDLLGHLDGTSMPLTYVDRVRDDRLRAVLLRFEAKVSAA